MKIRFSTVICTYNGLGRLSKTLDSLLFQMMNDFEVVVVDGASTDGTIELIRAYEKKFDGRLRWVSESDTGIYNAMNKGIRMARGEFINIIGAGDWLESDAISMVGGCFERHPEADAVYGKTRVWKEDLHSNRVLQTPPDDLPTQPMQHPSLFYRKSLHDTFGSYDERYRIVADYAFCLKAFYFGKASVVLSDEIFANFVMDGVSSKRRFACFSENMKLRRAFGLGTNFFSEGVNILKDVIRL